MYTESNQVKNMNRWNCNIRFFIVFNISVKKCINFCFRLKHCQIIFCSIQTFFLSNSWRCLSSQQENDREFNHCDCHKSQRDQNVSSKDSHVRFGWALRLRKKNKLMFIFGTINEYMKNIKTNVLNDLISF